jgi:ATP-dependent Clp protease ATP-binding subunit ClpB
MQRGLETRIGRAMIAGAITDGSTVEVDVKDGELAVNHIPEPEPVAAK